MLVASGAQIPGPQDANGVVGRVRDNGALNTGTDFCMAEPAGFALNPGWVGDESQANSAVADVG